MTKYPQFREEVFCWWKPSLYTFLKKDSPLACWVWEFFRRAVLKENFGSTPVDAMNPNPDFDKVLSELATPKLENGWRLSIIEDEKVDPDNPKLHPMNWALYYNWADPHWRYRKPLGIAASISCDEANLKSRYFGRQFKVTQKLIGKTWVEKRRKWIDMRIDPDRRDTVIRKDFEAVLGILRQKHPIPERASEQKKKKGEYNAWIDDCILQVWDLREFGVSWPMITNLFFEPDQQSKARYARNAAERYIELGGWEKLALYADLEKTAK